MEVAGDASAYCVLGEGVDVVIQVIIVLGQSEVTPFFLVGWRAEVVVRLHVKVVHSVVGASCVMLIYQRCATLVR